MAPDNFSLLIVDDEPNIRAGLAKGLTGAVDRIETAANSEEALDKFRDAVFHIVLVDVRLPSVMNGLELVEQLLLMRPETTAIVMTAHGTVECAVEAMRLGAFDFVTKPLDLDLIRHQVKKAHDHYVLQQENQSLRDRLADAGQVSGIIGNCASMQDVLQQVRQVAATDATVMIHGESGTGKELIARALHDLSQSKNKPFVAVNLGALPETLLESELFGHEKGSFTGAERQKPGCFERVGDGTLFLDEVTEMPAKSQIDLLRVLETRRYSRVGGESVLSTDARIVSATNRTVGNLIEDGTFREDLFYRLNVIPIEIPPLRQRSEDIPLLTEHFLTHFCQRYGRPPKSLAPEAMELLAASRWPGNVRQLRNMIERLVVTVIGEIIHASDVPADLDPSTSSSLTAPLCTLAETVEAAERQSIKSALAACGYHREKTAVVLGISVRTLHYKMSRYGLH